MVAVTSENADIALQNKEKGNEAFKKGDFDAAVKFYTNAITNAASDSLDRAVFLKNRAAAFLKLEKYDNAISDTTSALEISPNDPKALFRRCQAMEALERFEEAYRDAKGVLIQDPNNKAIQPILARLHNIVQRRLEDNTRIENKVQKMLDIAFDIAAESEKRDTAFNNLVVLARENAGADILWQKGIVTKLMKLLKSETSDSLCIAGVRVLGELCKQRPTWTKRCLQEVGIPWFINLFNYKSQERVNAIQSCIQTVINSLSGLENKPESKPNEALCETNKSEIESLLTCLLFATTSRTIPGLGRDAIIELITRNVHYTALNWAERLIEIGGLGRLMEVASELQEYKYESAMEITNNTRNIVAVCLCRIFENMYHDLAKQRFMKCIDEFLKEKLLTPELEGKVRAVVAITTLLLGAVDAGSQVVGKEGIMEMILVMASTEDDVLQQKVACECIIAAASHKDKAPAIVKQGANILKKLYASKDDSIRVRALVGLCKVGSYGGTDASIKPFADGSGEKLASACRKFLINPAKDRDMRRWAAEGLSYLTLDADVKEKLIEDKAALRALVELAKTGDHSCVYGVVTTFVNLCNAYDKQEVIPEMIELAKFAKHHIPQEHELDDQDFVDRRIEALGKENVTSALVELSKTDSHNSKELICRVLNAICSQKDLRGFVVQQGGAKALLPMALEGTDKGRRQAAQALARIAITINPEVAFPGQRCVEVVRPILSLLSLDCSALENFEALLALCNLASVSSTVRKRFIKESGLNKVESYMFEEHTMLRRAATQVMTNMVMEEDVILIYEGDNDKAKFLFLLCGEDDVETAKAASGALAMLTSVSAKVCRKLFDAIEWLDVFQAMLAVPDPDVQHRGLVIVENVLKADKELAQKLIETNIMEILMALTKGEDEKIAKLADQALKVAEGLNLIQKNTEEAPPPVPTVDLDDPDMPELE